MDLRYTSLALVNLLAGAFLVTATYGFDPDVTVHLGFGVSIAVVLVGLAMAYLGYSGAQRPEEKLGLGLLGLLTALLAAWTIIATSGTFDDETARWLVFASGLGHVALAVVGILSHEAITGAPAPRRRAPATRRRAPARGRR